METLTKMSLLSKEEEDTIMKSTIHTITTVKDACDRLMNHMIERYKQDKDSDVMTDLEKLSTLSVSMLTKSSITTTKLMIKMKYLPNISTIFQRKKKQVQQMYSQL